MAITTSEARRDLFGLIERVNLDHTEVEITSKRGSAVLMSKDEYDALVETSYLLRSPANAQRLLSALNAAREGKVVEHELADDPKAQRGHTGPFACSLPAREGEVAEHNLPLDWTGEVPHLLYSTSYGLSGVDVAKSDVSADE